MFDEVVVSTQLMNKIETVSSDSGVAVCQAGVVLEQLDTELAKHGLMVPLDLGAKGRLSTLKKVLRFLLIGTYLLGRIIIANNGFGYIMYVEKSDFLDCFR